MGANAGGLFIAIALAIYLLPSIIASCRDHGQLGAIFALNLLLGWTIIGWVGALVWALIKKSLRTAGPGR